MVKVDAIIVVLETISSKTAEIETEGEDIEAEVEAEIVAEVEAEIVEEDQERADILDQEAEVDLTEEGEEAVPIVVKEEAKVDQGRVNLEMIRRISKLF